VWGAPTVYGGRMTRGSGQLSMDKHPIGTHLEAHLL